jgi:uncharacterized protein YijF (DUF1287 family)
MPKPLKQNAQPKHLVDLHTKTRDQWEAELFDDAAYFTVAFKAGPGTIRQVRFDDLREAMRGCSVDSRYMLYVVASDNQQFMMPRKEWALYWHKWKLKKGIP